MFIEVFKTVLSALHSTFRSRAAFLAENAAHATLPCVSFLSVLSRLASGGADD